MVMGIRAILVCSLILLSFLLPYHVTVSALSLTQQQADVFHFLSGGASLTGFTPAELSHLDDVKTVMNGAAGIFFVLTLLTLFILFHVPDKKSFLFAALAVFLMDFLLLLLALFHFDQLFSSFHSLFFASETWIFPSDSLLIQLFPLSFFIATTKRILIGSLFSALVLLGVYHLYSKTKTK